MHLCLRGPTQKIERKLTGNHPYRTVFKERAENRTSCRFHGELCPMDFPNVRINMKKWEKK